MEQHTDFRFKYRGGHNFSHDSHYGKDGRFERCDVHGSEDDGWRNWDKDTAYNDRVSKKDRSGSFNRSRVDDNMYGHKGGGNHSGYHDGNWEPNSKSGGQGYYDDHKNWENNDGLNTHFKGGARYGESGRVDDLQQNNQYYGKDWRETDRSAGKDLEKGNFYHKGDWKGDVDASIKDFHGSWESNYRCDRKGSRFDDKTMKRVEGRATETSSGGYNPWQYTGGDSNGSTKQDGDSPTERSEERTPGIYGCYTPWSHQEENKDKNANDIRKTNFETSNNMGTKEYPVKLYQNMGYPIKGNRYERYKNREELENMQEKDENPGYQKHGMASGSFMPPYQKLRFRDFVNPSQNVDFEEKQINQNDELNTSEQVKKKHQDEIKQKLIDAGNKSVTDYQKQLENKSSFTATPVGFVNYAPVSLMNVINQANHVSSTSLGTSTTSSTTASSSLATTLSSSNYMNSFARSLNNNINPVNFPFNSGPTIHAMRLGARTQHTSAVIIPVPRPNMPNMSLIRPFNSVVAPVLRHPLLKDVIIPPAIGGPGCILPTGQRIAAPFSKGLIYIPPPNQPTLPPNQLSFFPTSNQGSFASPLNPRFPFHLSSNQRTVFIPPAQGVQIIKRKKADMEGPIPPDQYKNHNYRKPWFDYDCYLAVRKRYQLMNKMTKYRRANKEEKAEEIWKIIMAMNGRYITLLRSKRRAYLKDLKAKDDVERICEYVIFSIVQKVEKLVDDCNISASNYRRAQNYLGVDPLEELSFMTMKMRTRKPKETLTRKVTFTDTSAGKRDILREILDIGK